MGKMTHLEVRRRFAHVPPPPERAARHEEVRTAIGNLAVELVDFLPEGREGALVLTHLEEAMFWANAALARERPE